MDLDGLMGAGLLAAFRVTLVDGGKTMWLEDTVLPGSGPPLPALGEEGPAPAPPAAPAPASAPAPS